MNINIIDNAIEPELQTAVWQYLLNQTWYMQYKQDASIDAYIPSEHGLAVPNQNPISAGGTFLARAPLAKDVHYLKARHTLLHTLWLKINHALGNGYELTGVPEGINLPDDFAPPRSIVPTPDSGWRVYTNAQYQENIKHSHGVHRDNPNLDDATSATILYVANLEWYPTWFAECVYYNNQNTGDTQQFQVSDSAAQRRNFDIGWASQIVSPVPGRIIAYDGRTLHTTRPAAIWAPVPRVVVAFRARQR